MKETLGLKEGPSSGYQTGRTMRKTQRSLVGGDLNTGDGLGCKIEDRAARKNPGKYALCKNLDCSGIDVVEMTRNVKGSYRKRENKAIKKCITLTMFCTAHYDVVTSHCHLW